MIVFLLVLTGWNRTAADDRPEQSVDFRLSQIMVKLNQIEWELSQVKNRLGTQDQRLTDIDRKLERILEKIEEAVSATSATSTESASSSIAIDPAVVGTWRLARNDFAEEIPNNIRRYLVEREGKRSGINRYTIEQIDGNVRMFTDLFENILDQAGFRLIRFRPDGMYTDGAGDEGMWLVSADRLIMTTFDGRAYPGTYSMRDNDLTVTFTGDQIGTLFRLEAGLGGGKVGEILDQFLRYTDRVRLFYTRDF